MNINNIKEKIFDSQNLTVQETMFLFNLIMSGKISEIEVAGILIALKTKGETKDEILGAAKTMRDKCINISSPNNAVDTCGTGGDMSGTLNISTCSAIVAASAGVVIAKHGNRSISSKSGSADMLESLGYKISNNIDSIKLSLETENFCFLFAQFHHSAMKNVLNVRKNLKTRTIFNLLGPLTNPAKTKRQLLGVFEKKWVRTHCEVLKDLGSERAMVVHGDDGLDEISLSGISYISELKNNIINDYIFKPNDYGYDYINNLDIKGDNPVFNAKKFIEMLNGSNNNFQKIVELNAGSAIYLSGIAKNLKEGFEIAKNVIDKKISKKYLENLLK